MNIKYFIQKKYIYLFLKREIADMKSRWIAKSRNIILFILN